MVVLITGSNKGIGLAIAELFAKSGYPSEIIITSRNIQVGEKTLENLRQKYPAQKFCLFQLDISDHGSRTQAIAGIKQKFGKISVLINNAGFLHKEKGVSLHQQAIETLGINYFGTKDFTNEISELITDRIVTVASFGSGMAFEGASDEIKQFCRNPQSEEKVDQIANEFIDLTKEGKSHVERFGDHPVHGFWPYFVSKMLIRKLTEFQALKWPHLKVFSGCPGWVKSDMTDWMEAAPKTTEQGADIFWWMATSNEENLLNNSGQYFEMFRSLSCWDAGYDFSKLSSFTVPDGKEIGKH